MSGTFVYMTEKGCIHYDIVNCGRDCHVLVQFGSNSQYLDEQEENEALTPRREEEMDSKVSVASFVSFHSTSLKN
jgi:hypothetical protein